MKNFIGKALALGIGFTMLFPLTACNEKSETDTFVRDSEYVTITEFEQPVSLAHKNVVEYLNADPTNLVTAFLSSTNPRADKGNPVLLEYAFNHPKQIPVLSASVEISETEDFSTVVATMPFPNSGNLVEVYNLKTSAKYYFRVLVQLEDGKVHAKTGHFETADTPRFINLDGASNVRDIGGWKTEDGRVIKQGLLFRGGEIDGGKNTGHPDFCLTEKGIEQLLSLGIATDFDLRGEENKVSPHSILGSGVHREFYNAHQYQDVFNLSYKPFLRKMIVDLANPDAYPMYLHCTHGVDRAGTASALIEALLGVSKEDIIRDYELSAFYHNYAHVNRNFQNGGNILDFLNGFEKYAGDSLSQKCASFLLSIGVTQEEIDTIRAIFLG